MTTVLHLMPRTEWDQLTPGEPITNASLATEGFIHCTDEPAVMLLVANAFYASQPGDFVVVHVEVADLTSACLWEEPAHISPGGASFASQFPHVYGPIDREAVVEVESVDRDATGTFTGFAPLANTD